MLVNFAAFPLAIWWQLRRCRLLKILRIRCRAKSANRKCRKRILHAPESTQHTHTQRDTHPDKHWQLSNNMHRDMTSDDGTSGPGASQLKGAGSGHNGDGGTATFSLLHSLLLLLLQLRFMHFSCLDSVVSFGCAFFFRISFYPVDLVQAGRIRNVVVLLGNAS